MRSINECPVPRGILVAIGGHENKGEEPETMLQKENPNPLEVLGLLHELVKVENPIIEVITTASALPDESFKEYNKVFKEVGFSEVNHVHHVKRGEVLEDKELLRRLGKDSTFFFTGGDQLKLTSIYGGTKFLLMLKQRYIRERVVIAGTSAGAMALSTPMIYAGSGDAQEVTGEIKITTGLEFLKDVCVDTHFTDRNRFVRMAQVIASNPTCIGVGISEDTAMVVRNGREVEIFGSGMVVVMEGFDITDSNITGAGEKVPFSVQNLKEHMLSRGDKYEIPQNNPPHI